MAEILTMQASASVTKEKQMVEKAEKMVKQVLGFQKKPLSLQSIPVYVIYRYWDALPAHVEIIGFHHDRDTAYDILLSNIIDYISSRDVSEHIEIQKCSGEKEDPADYSVNVINDGVYIVFSVDKTLSFN